MSKDLRKIAVCTDFTPITEQALKEAIKLAERVNGEIYVIHIKNEKTETYETCKARLGKMVEHVGGIPEGIKIELIIGDEEESLIYSINREIKAHGVGLLIAGYHIKTGLQRYSAEYIMNLTRKSVVPLLAIKNDETLGEFKTITFPINLWDFARQKTNATIRLAETFGLKIKLAALSVNHTSEDDRKLKIISAQLEEKFKNHDLEIDTHWLTGKNENDCVIDFANQQGSDVIAKVFDHDPGFIERVIGNQDENLLNKTNKAIFVVQSHEYRSGDWGTMLG